MFGVPYQYTESRILKVRVCCCRRRGFFVPLTLS
jgi:hypothetical protein